MQSLDRRPGLDAQFIGERGLQATVGVEGIGLALGDVVGGDQLRPQRLAIRMRSGQALEHTDHGIGTSTGDFGFRMSGVHVDFILGERGRERGDELELGEVLEYPSTPLATAADR